MSINFKLYSRGILIIEGKILNDGDLNTRIVSENLLRMTEGIGYTVHKGYILVGEDKYIIDYKINYSVGHYESILIKVKGVMKKDG